MRDGMRSACGQLHHAHLVAAGRVWMERWCSTVSSGGRARRAASAALGMPGRSRVGVCSSLIKNSGRVICWRHPRLLASPLSVPSQQVLCCAPAYQRERSAAPQLAHRASASRDRRSAPTAQRQRPNQQQWSRSRAPLPSPRCAARRALLARLLPLGCIAARKSLVCWGVDRAARYQLACALVLQLPWSRPCGKSWWLWRPGSSDFQSASRHCNCPNSRGPAPHLRYRSSTLSPPRVCLQHFS